MRRADLHPRLGAAGGVLAVLTLLVGYLVAVGAAGRGISPPGGYGAKIAVLHGSGRLFLAEATLLDRAGEMLGQGSGVFPRSSMGVSFTSPQTCVG